MGIHYRMRLIHALSDPQRGTRKKLLAKPVPLQKGARDPTGVDDLMAIIG